MEAVGEAVDKDAAAIRRQISKEKGDTWPKVLASNYRKYGDAAKAMRHKHYGIWQPYTWKDYYLNVKYLALGLQSLGFEPGDKLIIIGDNAPEWYFFELAAQANQGVCVGMYSECTPREIKHVAENCEAGFAIAQDQEQVDKFLEIKTELPLLKKILYWDYKGLAHYDEPSLAGYRDVVRLGKERERREPGQFERSVQRGKADDVCAVVYTSGTTGSVPKGAIHTHGSLMTNAVHHLLLDPWSPKDNIAPYFPPAWITEQCFFVGCHLLSACTLNFAEAPETHQRDSNEAGPSIVVHGSRVWESNAATVRARSLAGGSMKKFVFRLLMPIGERMADQRLKKTGSGILLKVSNAVADAVLFRPIKRSLGLSRARICYTTGGAICPDALRFYHAIGVPLKNIYITTEGGALSGPRGDDIRLDTTGTVHEGAEVRIGDRGEIISRQTGAFSGYFKDPEKTSEVLRDGWFHSGDSGHMESDGHLVVMGRVNDLVDLPGGVKLSPQLLESRLRLSPYIKDAWVVASPGEEPISAVVVINYDTVRRWAGQRKVGFSSFADLSQRPEVGALIRGELEEINRLQPPGLRLKKFVLLHKEFSPEGGELTRTRKLRRTFLEKQYGELVTAIGEGAGEVSMKDKTRHREERRDGRMITLKIHSVVEVGK